MDQTKRIPETIINFESKQAFFKNVKAMFSQEYVTRNDLFSILGIKSPIDKNIFINRAGVKSGYQIEHVALVLWKLSNYAYEDYGVVEIPTVTTITPFTMKKAKNAINYCQRSIYRKINMMEIFAIRLAAWYVLEAKKNPV